MSEYAILDPSVAFRFLVVDWFAIWVAQLIQMDPVALMMVTMTGVVTVR